LSKFYSDWFNKKEKKTNAEANKIVSEIFNTSEVARASAPRVRQPVIVRDERGKPAFNKNIDYQAQINLARERDPSNYARLAELEAARNAKIKADRKAYTDWSGERAKKTTEYKKQLRQQLKNDTEISRMPYATYPIANKLLSPNTLDNTKNIAQKSAATLSRASQGIEDFGWKTIYGAGSYINQKRLDELDNPRKNWKYKYAMDKNPEYIKGISDKYEEIIRGIADRIADIDDIRNYNYDTGSKFLNDTADFAGNILPIMALSAVTGGTAAAPFVSPAAGASSAYGQASANILNKGGNFEEANKEGMISTIPYALFPIANKALSPITSKVASATAGRIGNDLLRTTATHGLKSGLSGTAVGATSGAIKGIARGDSAADIASGAGSEALSMGGFGLAMGLGSGLSQGLKGEVVPQTQRAPTLRSELRKSEYFGNEKNLEEIKKAYRQYAKAHHPDQFYKDGQARVDAETKIMGQINKEYADLEKLFAKGDKAGIMERMRSWASSLRARPQTTDVKNALALLEDNSVRINSSAGIAPAAPVAQAQGAGVAPAQPAGSVVASVSVQNIQQAKNNFIRQVENFSKGNLKSSEIISYGMTPAVYKEAINAPSLPMLLTQKTLDKAFNKHDFSIDEIINTFDQVQNPNIILKSASHKGDFVILTDMINKRGQEVIIPLSLYKEGNQFKANALKSIYGRSNFANWIKSQEVAWANENGLEMLNSFGLQLPTQIANTQTAQGAANELTTSYNNSIAENAKNVNNLENISPLTQTQEASVGKYKTQINKYFRENGINNVNNEEITRLATELARGRAPEGIDGFLNSIYNKPIADDFNKRIIEAKRQLKGSQITLSDTEKNELRYLLGSKWYPQLSKYVKITPSGAGGVDMLWQQLSEQYPDLFPAEILAPGDQLAHIIEFGKTPITRQTLGEGLGTSEQNRINEQFDSMARRMQGEAIRQNNMEEATEKYKRTDKAFNPITNKKSDFANEMEKKIAVTESRREVAYNKFHDAVAPYIKLNADPGQVRRLTQSIARDIYYKREAYEPNVKTLMGLMTEAKDGVYSFRGLIEDMKHSMLHPAEVTESWEFPDFATSFADMKDLRGKKIGLADGATLTPEMMIDKLAPKGSDMHKNLTQDIVYGEETAKRIANQVERWGIGELSRIQKETGFKPYSKEDAAANYLREGKKQVRGKDGWMEYAAYTMDDVKQAFPNQPEKWDMIQKASDEVGRVYDGMFALYDETLRKVYQPAIDAVKAQISDKENIISAIENHARRMKGMNESETKQVNALNKEIEKLGYEKLNLQDSMRQYELQFRKNYTHHGRKRSGFLPGLWRTITQDININPQIVGKTGQTEGYKNFLGMMLPQGKGAYTPGLIGNATKYIEQVAPVIGYTQHVKTMRRWNDELRDVTGHDKNANAVVSYMHKHINQIINKTNAIDREVQRENSRKWFQALNQANNRVRENAILWNASAGVANFFNLQRTARYIQAPDEWTAGVKGALEALNPNSKAHEKLADSTFWMSKFEDTPLNLQPEKLSKYWRKGGIEFMRIGDRITSAVTWFAAREQGIKKGLSGDELSRYADTIARRAAPGFTTNEMPRVYNSKLAKVFAPFQHQVGADKREYAGAIRDLFNGKPAGFIGMTVTLFIMNGIIRKFIERQIGPDPIGNAILGFNENPDDSVAMRGLNAAKAAAVDYAVTEPFANLAFKLIPENFRNKYIGDRDPDRFGGASMVTDALLNPLADLTDAAVPEDGVDKRGKAADAVQDLLLSFGLPGGGVAVNRAVSGMQNFGWLPRYSPATFDEEGNINSEGGWRRNEFPASYDKKGKLRFPMNDSIGTFSKNALFGTFATRDGRDYLESNKIAKGENKTAQIEELYRMGANPKYAIEIIDAASALKPERDSEGNVTESGVQKIRDFVLETKLTPEQRDYMFSEVFGKKEDINAYARLADINRDAAIEFGKYYGKLRNYENMNYKEQESFDKNYGKYVAVEALGVDMVDYLPKLYDIKEIKGVKDSKGKTISGSYKAAVEKAIKELDIPQIQKDLLFITGYSSFDAGTSTNVAITSRVLDYINGLDIDDVEKNAYKELLKLPTNWTATSGGSGTSSKAKKPKAPKKPKNTKRLKF